MRKITTIIAIALFILNVTGCSSNKTNGMPKNITLGGSYSSLEKNYKNEDNDSERFFDISDQKLGDLKVNYECVKDDKKDIIKEIRVSELGSNSKKILNEFTRLYGKPIHKENYNDKRYDATDIWKLDDGKYVFLNLDDDSYATFKLVSEKTIAKQKKVKKKRDKLLKEDKDLKKIYDAMLQRSMYQGRNISSIITDFSSKFDYYYYTWINSSKAIGAFEDTIYAGDYTVKFKYKYENPYIAQFASKVLGQITTVSCTFDDTGKYKDTAALMEALFGKRAMNGVWEYSPCRATLNTGEIYLSKPDYYLLLDPAYNNSNSTKKIKKDSEATEEQLFINQDEIYLTLDEYNDRSSAISFAERAVEERLKVPSSATFCLSADYKGYRSGKKVYVQGYVYAENSFGAKIKTNFTVSMNISDSGSYTLDAVYFPKF